MAASIVNQPKLMRRGRQLEYFTIGWNSLEAIVSIGAGVLAGSVSLIGFGLDSVIETASGAAILWRLQDHSEQREKIALRLVGTCFLLLAVYVLYESAESLLSRTAPETSIPGIIIAALSLIVMPLLSAAKRRVAAGLNSAAVLADARQTDFCMYLSAILLVGLLLNALLGWWWADPAAGLVMVPIIAKEGLDNLRGTPACACH